MVFNANEILEIAMKIERNGARFYQKAAEHVSEAAARTLLTELAAWEVGHEKTFAAIRQKFAESGTLDESFDPDAEAMRYLQAFADGHVFDVNVDPTTSITESTTLRDILNVALQREKDAVVFFVGLKDLVPQALGVEEVDRIIKEEMTHITQISNHLSRLE